MPVSVTVICVDDFERLRGEFDLANSLEALRQVDLVPAANGDTVMHFRGVSTGSSGALPNLTGRIFIREQCEPRCKVIVG